MLIYKQFKIYKERLRIGMHISRLKFINHFLHRWTNLQQHKYNSHYIEIQESILKSPVKLIVETHYKITNPYLSRSCEFRIKHTDCCKSTIYILYFESISIEQWCSNGRPVPTSTVADVWCVSVRKTNTISTVLYNGAMYTWSWKIQIHWLILIH